MTSSDILNIVVTVALSQLACELLAKYFIYNGEAYQKALSTLERSRSKLQRAEADAAKNAKHAKRLQIAKDDFNEACSQVSTKHMFPGTMSSIFFLVLLRILGTEHKGKVIAVLPFVPIKVFSRITARGLDWSLVQDESVFEGLSISYKQGTSFLFIYMLAALSIKHFVTLAFGTQPPPGADRGLMAIMESPSGKRFAKKNFGLDTEELLKQA